MGRGKEGSLERIRQRRMRPPHYPANPGALLSTTQDHDICFMSSESRNITRITQVSQKASDRSRGSTLLIHQFLHPTKSGYLLNPFTHRRYFPISSASRQKVNNIPCPFSWSKKQKCKGMSTKRVKCVLNLCHTSYHRSGSEGNVLQSIAGRLYQRDSIFIPREWVSVNILLRSVFRGLGNTYQPQPQNFFFFGPSELQRLYNFTSIA